MNRIKYICYYSKPDDRIHRKSILSATNKIDYIIDVANRNGFLIDIISASYCDDNNHLFAKEEIVSYDGINRVHYFLSIGGKKSHLKNIINDFLISFQLFFWLLFNIQKGEVIMVYHSTGYLKLIDFLNRKKNITIIGEVEEIYHLLCKTTEEKACLEEKVIRNYDKYIFPTQLLQSYVNNNKPNIVIHGSYRTSEIHKSKRVDDNIHVVYAGTFDPRKGVLVAIKAARYLPSVFHLHILGFGNVTDTESVKACIEEVNKGGGAKVSYDGLKHGDDYLSFIHSCQIGLSPQDPDSSFNTTSFPSKIVSYMGNGLQVVSIRIRAIEESYIGEYIYFYDKQTPEEVASAIINASRNLNPCKSIDIIKKLDIQFAQSLSAFILE